MATVDARPIIASGGEPFETTMSAAASLPLGGDADVEVQVVWEPPWNPTMMSDAAAGALGFQSRQGGQA